jgi:uncharacterized protein
MPNPTIRKQWLRHWIAAILVLAGCAHSSPTSSEKRESRQEQEEAVHFANGDVALAGTLVLPDASAQRHPAVILFHGSGPQTRDLFTARWFAKRGIAALAYDKRGVGESTGNFRAVPLMELCGDGLAALQYLKSRKDIDPKRIGVWGLSQGGWLGPLAASRSADVAFVIAVSGPAVSPGEQMIFYYAMELRAQGVPESDVQEASTLRRNVWNYLFTGKGYDQAKKDLSQARTKRWYNGVRLQQDDLFGRLDMPSELSKPNLVRFKREMTYDPIPALQALRVPALFLFGDEDRLVNVDESVPIIRRVLTQSGHRDFTIRIFHHVDHGMHLTTNGNPDPANGNVAPAVGDVAPEYLSTMQSWVSSHLYR